MADCRVKISPRQSEYLQATTRLRMFLGGIASGKTTVESIAAVTGAMRKQRNAIISFSYPNLRDVVADTIVKVLRSMNLEEGRQWVFARGDMEFRVMGTDILLRSASDDLNKLRGLSLHFAQLDEARQFDDREVYDILLGRIRESESGWLGLVSTTKGKNWFYRLVEQAGLTDAFTTGYARNDDATVVVQSTLDSPFVPDVYKNDIMRQYSSQFAAQEIFGQIIEFSAGVINPAWFKVVPNVPCQRGVRFWDLAVSEKTSADCSAGVLASYSDGAFTIHDLQHGRFEYPLLRKLIIDTAKKDGESVTIGIEASGTQLGFAQDILRCPELSGHIVKPLSLTKSKLARALPWATRAEQGLVRLCDCYWVDKLREECGSFTSDDSHEHDDIVDAISGAYYVLTTPSLITSKVSTDIQKPAEEDLPYCEPVCSAVMDGTRVVVLTGLLNGIKFELQVVNDDSSDMLSEVVRKTVSYKRVVVPEDFSSLNNHALYSELMRQKVRLFLTDDYDEKGLLIYANNMLSAGSIRINPQTRLYGEMQQTETVSPTVKAFLLMVSDMRRQYRVVEKQYAPLGRTPLDEREKTWTAPPVIPPLLSQTQGWV